MTTSTAWQLAGEAAEKYQQILTPTILGPFAQALAEAANIKPGDHIADIGTGTGAAARYAAGLAGPSGRVIGIDVNPAMITVAQSLTAVSHPTIEWRVADAGQLPLEDAQFDLTLCAQSLQFMPDKLQALSEMKRVTRPNGRIAISLWSPIWENPYFDTLVQTIGRHINRETAAGLNAAFALSNRGQIENLLHTAQFTHIEITIIRLDLPLPPLAQFIPRHISATPMAAGFNNAPANIRQTVIREIIHHLAAYTQNDPARIPFNTYIINCKN